jgi:succinate-acetate transporter protein
VSTQPTGAGADRAARVVLRPIGNPLPLGFLALAAGTLLVSGLQLGWFEPAEGQQVALILMAFVFPLQLVSSIFGFLARDVVAGTGMGVLCGTWLSIGAIRWVGDPGTSSDPLGVLLLLAAVAMLVPAAAASTGKLVAAAVLTTTSLRFAVTGVHEITAGSTTEDVAGVVGLVLCVLAVYAALAMTLEDALRRTVLPVGRRGSGASALDGDLQAQLDGIEHEAGVREQL